MKFFTYMAAAVIWFDAMPAFASSQVGVEPSCFVSNGQLSVHTMLFIDETFDGETARLRGAKSAKTREIWQILCGLRTRKCQAVRISLDKFDSGGKIGPFDITMTTGMTLTSSSKNVFSIVWGPWTQLTVDLKTRRIAYSRSGPTSEGRGSGACDDTDAAQSE